MAGRVFVTPRGTMPPGYGKCYRTDAEYLDAHINDPTVNAHIGTAPAQMGVRSNIERCCRIAATFGLGSRISGAPKGDVEAMGQTHKPRTAAEVQALRDKRNRALNERKLAAARRADAQMRKVSANRNGD